jgi:hypothetical protein
LCALNGPIGRRHRQWILISRWRLDEEAMFAHCTTKVPSDRGPSSSAHTAPNFMTGSEAGACGALIQPKRMTAYFRREVSNARNAL